MDKWILHFSLLLVLLGFVFFGSKKGEVTALLRVAEKSIEKEPDKALILLDSIQQMEELSEQQQALWCLLYTSVLDRKQIKHTSDSLIQIAVSYYEKNDLPERKMQAYYYYGIALQDLNDAIQAQDYYLRAYKLGIELERYVFLGRICANLGTLYTYQDLYSQASYFQQKAVGYFEKNRDTVRLSLVFRDMARIHLNEHRLDSAVANYTKALKYTSDVHKFCMFNELTGAYARTWQGSPFWSGYQSNHEIRYIAPDKKHKSANYAGTFRIAPNIDRDLLRYTDLSLGGVGCLLFVVCIIFYLWKERKKKEEQLNQSLRRKEQQYLNSQQYLEERNAVMAQLEQQYEAVVAQLSEQSSRFTTSVQEKINSSHPFFTSELYRGVYAEWKKLDEVQWAEVIKMIDHILYKDFTGKIRMLYPRISELDLNVCYLVKLEIPVGRIAVLLSVNSQAISNKRKRLYEKLTQEKGSAQDFDKFIKTF